MGALIITYIILGVPYYKYSIMGPKTPILIIKAPTLFCSVRELHLLVLLCCRDQDTLTFGLAIVAAVGAATAIVAFRPTVHR